jgi:mannose-6-phosphate isomerase-like protein (cupin superfamily)
LNAVNYRLRKSGVSTQLLNMQSDFMVSREHALATLAAAGKQFTTLFRHGSMELEIYKPVEKDRQTPHDRDEVYVVAAGNGQFFCNGETAPFTTGDVPAGVEHRFFDFSNDFSAWVIFYGPGGGEKGIT